VFFLFKFLKEKLKNTIADISNKIEKESPEEEIEKPVEEQVSIDKKEDISVEKPIEPKENKKPEEITADETSKELDIEEKEEEKPEEKKTGIFGKIKGIFAHKDEEISGEDKERLNAQLEGRQYEPKVEEKAIEASVEDKKEESKPEKKEEKPAEISKEEPKTITPDTEEIKDKPKEEKKGFFSKLKDKLIHKEEEHEEKEFTEEEKIEKPDEEKKPESQKQVAKVKIKETLEKGKIPSIQDLMERKGLKPKPIQKLEEKPKEEPKPQPSVQDIAFGRLPPKEPKKKELPPEIEKFKKKEPEETPVEEPKPEVKEEKPTQEPKIPTPSIEEKKEEPVEEKKGFFSKLKEKIITKKISEKQFDELFWNLEVVLLENNVAVEVIDKIKQDLKDTLVNKPIPRTKISQTIIDSLNKSLTELFDVPELDIFEKMEKKKPLVICFLGVNGSGKTTTIAKVAALLQKYKFSCVMAAADTFRAAAIDQLEEHAKNLDIKLIKHDYNSDPAAVAFDAVKYAEAKNIDVVLIDTAGRLHSNVNLMDEMKKIIRVANPDIKLFIGEAITGNDCVEQAKQFDQIVGIDGIILSKADVDEKGGAAISVSYVTKKPILYLGVGQRYEDLEEFNSKKILESLGL